MPPRRAQPIKITQIEQRRLDAGLTQQQLAEQADISARTLQRIEHRDMENPPIRYLANLAIVLQCELEDLIEPEWREWLRNRWGKPKAKRRKRIL